MELGDKIPHRNREISQTYAGEEDPAIGKDQEGDEETTEPVEINKMGDSDEHRIPLNRLVSRF